ncbi:MAG: class II fumarate hydratase [Deltaproteobacteria bacterium]|nr:class II fumarate hydratase [Deltaproteobacteria bacterium]
MSDSKQYRVMRDSMGEMKVPVDAYYGAQTQRAVENFPISGIRFSRPMLKALGIIKRSAAIANKKLNLLDSARADLIVNVSEEVERGELDAHFVLDIFQTGSGTSTNMNVNEVIANRAKEVDAEVTIHPNDHVNMSQSSNDVIPTAIHLAAAMEIKASLLPALEILSLSLSRKVVEFDAFIKTGRTHLQDATPIRLGQEFGGYKSQVDHARERLERALSSVLELAQGGTAVGTGLNAHPDFPATIIEEISKRTGIKFVEASNHFEAQSARDAIVELSGVLKTIACSLAKISNDIRWLGSGPRCGIGELALPEVQPGSSIMPGKVNPVIAESVLMACAQVIGNDAAITIGGYSGGNFELNVMMPLMAHNVLQSIMLLANSATNFARRCVDGIKANSERLLELAEASIAVVTALAPQIGYDEAASIAKEAYSTKASVREVALKRKVLSAEELDKALDLMSMTHPGL